MDSKLLRQIWIIALAVSMTLCFIVSGNVYGASCKDGKHQYVVTITKHATETKEGQRKFVCSECGHTYKQKIEVTGHVWGKWKTVKEATCTKDGKKERRCTKHPELEHVEKKAIKATGHDWGKWKTVRKATTKKKGLEKRVCKNDSSEVQYRTLARLTPKASRSSGSSSAGSSAAGGGASAGAGTGTGTGTGGIDQDSYPVTLNRENNDNNQDGNSVNDNTDNNANDDARDLEDQTDSVEGSDSQEAEDAASSGAEDGSGSAGDGSGAGDGSSAGSGAGAGTGTGSSYGAETKTAGGATVPFGAADAVLLGANGAATIFWALLLLPLVRVMFWVAAKRREKEEEESVA